MERRREDLYRELSRVGDFRRGSLNEVRRKYGKPNCFLNSPGPREYGYVPVVWVMESDVRAGNDSLGTDDG